jgi:hypothetical protein
MTKKKEPVRTYRFTDGKLVQVFDGVMVAVDRDTALMAPRGYTPERCTALIAQRNLFADFPIDDYYAGEQGIKTEARDFARGSLITPLRTIFTAAENVYGTKSKHFRQFGNPALSRITDNDLIRRARNIVRTATLRLDDLKPEGITTAMLTQVTALIKTFDDSVDLQLKAGWDREDATAERVEMGNALYDEVVKICNTGKDIWYEVNEAKYKNYVIYNTPSGEPEPTGFGSLLGTVTDGSGQPVEGAIVTILNTELTEETDAEGDYAFEQVPVGKQSEQVTAPGFKVYTDDVVEIFDGEETRNDIDLEPEEPEG